MTGGDARSRAALVGLGLMVPGASDPGTLWENVVGNRTFFRQAEERDFGADPALFLDPGPPAPDKAYSLSGAWLDAGPEDLGDLRLPGSFNPAEADPSLLYWLWAARAALPASLMAGHRPQEVGVIAGHVILPTRAMSEATLSLYGREATRGWEMNPFPPPPRTNPFRAVGYSARLAAEALGLAGPAFTVDAACASSLYALRLALDRLRDGSLSLVLSGGLAQADPLFTQLGFSQLRALSREGVSRPFDARADGLVVGSGAVALALKRLDRALADGDPVICVISGVGLSNDRRGNLLAPDPEGQERAMRKAFADAGLPEGLAPGLFEAHGTSTPLGDAAEMAAIKGFLAGRDCGFPPVVGSVKGNVGHLLSAAGAVSLAKASLALQKAILPPSAGYRGPAPGLGLTGGPAVRILSEAVPWPSPSQGRARVAAVNAFGFGGVNAQAVLEEFRPGDWAAGKAKAARPPRKGARAAKEAKEAAAEPQAPAAARPAPSAFLIAARTVLAPWPNYDALARYWLTPEEPPMAGTRRLGGLKATGFFFDSLSLDVKDFHLPPKELAEALPQQTLAFKASMSAIRAAGLDPLHWPESLDPDRVGIFMGVEIDPRSADYALRWLAPHRASQALAGQGLSAAELEGLREAMRRSPPPPLSHSRVLGALGSFVASRLARYLGVGGPAFTMSEEQDSGLRALREATAMLQGGEIDLALVGVVDTFGDPKTAALAPRTIWAEGAAALVLASPRAARSLRPLAELTLTESSSRLGPLSGLFGLNRSGFYLRHHLRPLGRGHGFAYWLQNPQDPPRSLEGPGYRVVETPGARPQPLTVPSDPVRTDVWFFVRGDSDGDLRDSLDRLRLMAEANPGRDLLGLAQAHLAESPPGRPRLALLARDARELQAHLKRALAGEEDPDLKPRLLLAPPEPIRGQLAWVFPGSGNHYKGLGRGLAVSFPEVMAQLEAESENPVGLFQSSLFWEPNHKRPSVREAILAQVCFGLLGARLLDKMDLRPQAALGYSLGEVSALVATGLWPDRDELYRDLQASTLFNSDLAGELQAPRAFWNWPAHKPLRWLSALIPRPEAQARAALEALPPPHRHRAFVLLVNTRDEIVAGGEEAAVQLLAQALETPLFPVEDVAAVHAPVVGPVLEKYARFHTRKIAPDPSLSLYSCARAMPIGQDPAAVAQSLADQAMHGHRFPDLIERAYLDGVRFFVEVGPGNSASRMIRSILGDRPHLAQSLASTAVDEGWTGLNRLLAELWLAGYPLAPERTMLQPSPAPDPRFQVPINLLPPEVDWPVPGPAFQAEAREASPAAAEGEDYLAWLDRQTSGPPRDRPPMGRPPREGPPRKGRGAEILSRADCLEFAVGSIAKALGPDFAQADLFPSRVRLPDEPLMFVDRVTALEGQPLSLGPGRLVTEHDIRGDEWCVEDGRLSPGMAIESGQADLLLSAYLGADFSTRGLASYRLLDAEVTFHGDLPLAGQTPAYEIRLNGFFSHADTLMFRFEFDAAVAGQPLLSMRRGCAGFFSPQALAAGKGLPSAVPEPPPLPPADPPFDLGPFPGTGLAASLDGGALEALRSGDPSPLGPIFAQAPLEAPILLPGGRLGLIHRAPEIDLRGGAYGAGFIRAEADVDPGAWYLRSHFRGDEVMPGTLMYDGCLQALRLLLLARGWLGPRGSAAFQPPRGLAQTLRCRGQVTPGTARVAYEVHVRRVGLWPDPEFLPDADPGLPREPYALAEAIMLADGRPIVAVSNLALRLSGLGPDSLAALWLGPRRGPAVPDPGPAPRTARRAAKAAPAAEAPPGPSPVGPAPEAAPRAATRRGRPPKGREAPPPPPVAVKVRGRREAGQDAPAQAGTSRQGQELFDKARLTLMSTGLLSEALGPLFARFDQGAFVARLPRAPFDFIDEALVRKGRLGQVAVGTQVEAAMDLSAASRGWLLAQAGGKRPVIPYAAINEMALQPCGFLAAFMGAALPFEGPMHFRNLGGEATLLAHVDDLRGRIQARATLTKSSVLGAMTILHYHFSLSWDGQPLYEGQTHFGFHSPESLARPLGLKANPGLLKALTAPAAQGPSRPFPQGPSWPEGPWRMVDSLVADTKGDGRVWGRTRVDPKAWFFAAHFPQDPVWPGSLGLEGFLQSAKALWAALFRPDDDPADLSLSWQAPFAGQQHRWLYRGQVIPFNKDVTFGLKVVGQRGSVLTLKGLMWVDGQVVYQVDDLTVGLAV